MPRSREMTSAMLRSIGRLVAIVLLAVTVPAAPSLAQAAGHVRVKIVKAGLLVGGGAGTGHPQHLQELAAVHSRIRLAHGGSGFVWSVGHLSSDTPCSHG